jgi:hypothetical protein
MLPLAGEFATVILTASRKRSNTAGHVSLFLCAD